MLDGYNYVNTRGKYEIYRRIFNRKGRWKAKDMETEEVFDITYDQALGYEPIRPTPIQQLAIDLGKKLLPRR